ncbi:nitrous oxide reductase family maturation protein NosD [Tenacibaculum tangerinum]|uniref:Nitrous oxide reductase family maturation protein NosD n=1 Tax=Tenacibaculum tangerinum TaxID=3038772 RepID=A0ABY8L2J0_9FLAO|nr:nitrous oxide reductase family maturation protein NosD [Tenacibaculum tangerinum]WGH74867.1 nitrous oxide reductase family maturation protein NosD [Tenacibaculum tangerinum]
MIRLPILFFLFISVSSVFSQQTIQEKIEATKKSDTLVIHEGVYKEHDITISKPITIIGKGKVIIDAEKKGYVFKILSDSVALKNIIIKNVGRSYTKDYAAIYVSRSNNLTIEKVTLENVFFGMLIEKSKNIHIKNSSISSEAKTEAKAGNGIHLWHCSNAIIDGNELHNLRDGIYFEFVKNSVVKNNHSHHNIRYGLHFMFSNNNEYSQNTFNNNGAGVAVMFSKYITMTHNKFLKNWGTASYGLLLKEIYDAEIVKNEFSENTVAVNLEGSTRINYTHNTFSNNGWALKVAGACYKNIFTKNNFLNNSFDVSYNSKINDNSFEGNYWSSYTGYDLNKDAIGDVPYRPVKLFSYIVNQTPETIILLRSLFVDIINFSEKVTPVFTPKNLVDKAPLMQKYND